MAGPDANAQAALRGEIVRPIYVGWLDILGDPIRVTTAPYGIAFNGTGDEDLDGFTFDALDPQFIGVSSITMKEGGSETVTVTLSGLIGLDTDLMNQIGQKTNWQGRVARLWRLQYNEQLQQVGSVWPFWTGYMTAPKVVGNASGQTIALEIEGYQSFLTAASNRSYLNQADYDAADTSAAVTIACANGQLAGQFTAGAVTTVASTLRLTKI